MKEKNAKAQPRLREAPAEEARRPADSDMQRWIAEAAYYRAQSRGFEPGREEQDWLAAEADIVARVRSGAGLA
jgi:hypothetical protein